MKLTPIDRGVRDSYWHATQDALNSVRRRGDFLIVGIVAALVAFAYLASRRYEGLAFQLLIVCAVLAAIGANVWLVAKRRREIAAARGLVCTHCSYAPHDTEIDDVAHSRKCPRCGIEL